MKAYEQRAADGAHPRAAALAEGLGWFSIALGTMELVAPRAMARMLGLRGRERLIKLYGMREIAAGLGLLHARDPAPWLWARVAGDALDLATLGGRALDSTNPRQGNAALAALAVASVAAIDVACAVQLSNRAANARGSHAANPHADDYADCSGLPLPPEAMRGTARDFEVPDDMRTPAALRPYA